MKKVIPEDANLLPDHAKRVFKGKIFDVYQYEQELYDGTKSTFEMLKRPDTVNACIVVDGKIIVLEDEQPHRDMVLALPGGRVDPTDTSTLEAIKREVHEETGYDFSNWKLISVVKPSEKIEWFIYTYLAWGEHTVSKTHIDSGERIKVLYKTFDEVKELQEEGQKRFNEFSAIKNSETLENLLALPEFKGKVVDR